MQQGVFGPETSLDAQRPLCQHQDKKVPIAGVRINDRHPLQGRQTRKIKPPAQQLHQPPRQCAAFELQRIRAWIITGGHRLFSGFQSTIANITPELHTLEMDFLSDLVGALLRLFHAVGQHSHAQNPTP